MTAVAAVRVARQTSRLDQVVRFYRDDLALPEIGRFDDHGGYTGVLLDVPGTGTHLEFIESNDGPPPHPHPESLLILYLGNWEAVHATAEGLPTVTSTNPYWDRNGVTVVDPDEFRVVLVAHQWRA